MVDSIQSLIESVVVPNIRQHALRKVVIEATEAIFGHPLLEGPHGPDPLSAEAEYYKDNNAEQASSGSVLNKINAVVNAIKDANLSYEATYGRIEDGKPIVSEKQVSIIWLYVPDKKTEKAIVAMKPIGNSLEISVFGKKTGRGTGVSDNKKAFDINTEGNINGINTEVLDQLVADIRSRIGGPSKTSPPASAAPASDAVDGASVAENLLPGADGKSESNPYMVSQKEATELWKTWLKKEPVSNIGQMGASMR
jgi:hypothetical protein